MAGRDTTSKTWYSHHLTETVKPRTVKSHRSRGRRGGKCEVATCIQVAASLPALRISHFVPLATSRNSRCSREASAAPVVVDGSTSSSQSKRWCKQELLIRRSARLSRRRTRPQQVSKVDERLLLRVSIITPDLLAAAASSGAGRGAHWQLLQACPYGLFAFRVWTNHVAGVRARRRSHMAPTASLWPRVPPVRPTAKWPSTLGSPVSLTLAMNKTALNGKRRPVRLSYMQAFFCS